MLVDWLRYVFWLHECSHETRHHFKYTFRSAAFAPHFMYNTFMSVSGHGTSDANFKYYEIPFKYTFCSEVLAPQCIEKISSMVSLMHVAMMIYVHESHGYMFDRFYSNKNTSTPNHARGTDTQTIYHLDCTSAILVSRLQYQLLLAIFYSTI